MVAVPSRLSTPVDRFLEVPTDIPGDGKREAGILVLNPRSNVLWLLLGFSGILLPLLALFCCLGMSPCALCDGSGCSQPEAEACLAHTPLCPGEATISWP